MRPTPPVGVPPQLQQRGMGVTPQLHQGADEGLQSVPAVCRNAEEEEDYEPTRQAMYWRDLAMACPLLNMPWSRVERMPPWRQ
eukprot:982799-Amphidinium_carterae.1